MASREMISVETVVQGAQPDIGDVAVDAQPPPLLRQQHRVAANLTIRGLLDAAGLGEVVEGIEQGRLGLAVHGKRAWLDDILVDGSRIEAVAPIQADAKAARVARAAADRGRRRPRVSSVR